MRILVAIPCYNCDAQIQRVLQKLSLISLPPEADVLLVENDSQDKTKETIKSSLGEFSVDLKGKFKVLFHKKNYGLGGSFKTIFEYARQGQYEHIILFHGDDQASEKDLLKFIKEVKDTNPDCLFGARFMPGSILHNYSAIREKGNKAINFIFSLLLGKSIYEIGSGLNAYKVNALPDDEVLYYPDHIAFDVNLLLHFMGSDQKYDSRFMPIEWFEKDQRSNASNIRVGIDVLTMLVKFKLGMKNLVREKSVRHYEEYCP